MMIETKGLTKMFGEYKALDNAEVHVEKGSIYGLVGPNGAGKSTIIRHIAGVMRPDSGQVFVNGELVYENPAAKQIIAHIPDDLYFFPSAGIMEMAQFYSNMYPTFSWQQFNKIKSAFPLDLKRPLRRFSRGMQKQAAIWLALSCCPQVILLDEPVDGLDPVMRRTVWSLILQDVAEKGTTVFISSHNLRELEDVCDHVGIMHKGKMLMERNLSDLQTNIFKLQIAFEGEPPAEMQQFEALHIANSGRVYEYILRGKQNELLQHAQQLNPLLLEALPLSLEEIFIYELGGMDYAQILV